MGIVRVVLVATYDLGRQPFGLASPAAWLRERGFEVHAVDLSRQRLPVDLVREARLVAFFLPMHTATRLAGPVIRRVGLLNPSAELCAYGIYAPVNAEWLRSLGVSTVLGGEFEDALTALAVRLASAGERVPASEDAARTGASDGADRLPHLAFRVPDRQGLPPLSSYAALRQPGQESRMVAYTEASRGCRHSCRHCPVVPVYNGRFRLVPVDVVMADVHQQVAAGARHVTYGDPDFFNGPAHALRVVEALARECPGITYDVTIKVEHLLRHERHLPTLRRTGCVMVTSAVESIDDDVLARLAKGHTRWDFERAVVACREAGLALAPTFIPFTPWTSVAGYVDLLESIAALDLVPHVAPIQLTLRLLIPEGSLLRALPEVSGLVEAFDPGALVYPWRHPDPGVDALQRKVAHLVAAHAYTPREALFDAIRATAARHLAGDAGAAPASLRPPFTTVPGRVEVPYLDEPWYC